MTRTAIVTPDLPSLPVPLSYAIRSDGQIFVSGQVGLDLATGKLVEGGIAMQTEKALQNLTAVLKAADKSLADVVRAGVYLTSMADFAAMNAVYARLFSEPYPARTTVAVAALPFEACVEIDLIVKA